LVNYISDTQPSNPSSGETWLDTDADVVKVYDGTAWRDITDHEARHEIGGADQLNEWLQVKRDLTGGVVFNDIATGLTTGTTATGTAVTTNTSTTGQILFTQAVLSLTGAFTTGEATLLRNASTLVTTSVTGTITVSTSISLTGTNTWTARCNMVAGTSITAGLTARRDARTTVVPR